MLKITNKTTIQNLVDYAREELGVNLETEGKEKKDLIAEVQAIEKDMGLDNDGASDKSADADGGTGIEPPAGAENARFVVINIHQPPAPDEESEPDTHCEVGFNGRIFQIQYGEDVKVPFGVYDVLRNAIQTKYYQKKNAQSGQQELHNKQVKRFPFNVIEFIN
jgi:hypothetical protein